MENIGKYAIYLLFLVPIVLMVIVTIFSAIIIIADTAFRN